MNLATLKKGYAGMNAGVWVGPIPYALYDRIRIKSRRLWNPDYQVLHDKLSAERSALSAEAQESEQESERRITTECLLETCVLDWEGIDDPFSVDAARAFLADADAGPTFRNALLYAAAHVADEIKAQLEADEKN